MQELVESQKMNSQYVAAAMGAAQQQAASEYERLHAESLAAQQQTEAARSYWRHRAERATARCHAAAAALAAARSSLESLLARLVTATSVADLADQSRILFEVKAAVIDVEGELQISLPSCMHVLTTTPHPLPHREASETGLVGGTPRRRRRALYRPQGRRRKWRWRRRRRWRRWRWRRRRRWRRH